MTEFERSRDRGGISSQGGSSRSGPPRRDDRGGSSRSGPPRRDDRGGRSFRDGLSRGPPSRGRDFGRNRGGRDRDRREVTMTQVTCSSCGNKCEVPFKPTSSKPVYCSDCFKKQNDGGGRSDSRSGGSSRDLDVINEKLNKIMKALDIE